MRISAGQVIWADGGYRDLEAYVDACFLSSSTLPELWYPSVRRFTYT